MKFGERLCGKITQLDEKGRGVFVVPLAQNPTEHRRVVVPYTAVGDDITATFIRRDKGSWIGRLAEIHSPSPDRIAPPCVHAGTCGGCLWQHLSYQAQIALKKQGIERALERAGLDASLLSQIIPSTHIFSYRNRMDYVIGWQGTIGLKEYGSWNRYVDVQSCPILDEEAGNILNIVRSLMHDFNLAPWDARRHTGQLRYVVIRLGTFTHERMITLVVHQADQVNESTRNAIVERLRPFCTSLYLGEQPTITDISLAKTLTLLHGTSYLHERINGISYHIHPNAFFQTNSAMAQVLQQTVLNFVSSKPTETENDLRGRRILDLYCGLGFFGIACAKQGATVYGHELDEDAVRLATHNAELNGVTNNASFGSGPVEQMNWPNINADTVIVDPPRSGLHPNALKTLMEKKPPTIIYVSCNYRKLIEELETLKTIYEIDRMIAIDLFPQTPHVEVVTKLELR